MALQVQLPPLDFDFNNGRASPSDDARPSTPKRFGELFFSAPTSPARASAIYRGFDDLSFAEYERAEASTSSSPWDRGLWSFESPNRADDFALANSSGHASPRSHTDTSNGGKIKNSKPPLYGRRVEELETIQSPLLSPQTPNSKNSRHKKSIWSTFSPKRKKESNKIEAAAVREPKTEKVRGRERVSELPASRSGRRAARSVSPLRVSKYPWEEEEEEKSPRDANQASSATKPPSSALTLSSSSKGHRKWRLKDFLLFRSASEGRASEKDPFRKYAEMYRKHHVTQSSGSKLTDGSSESPKTRKGHVSPHELHYTANKAMSQDMKKKTFLPYKQGIVGKLAVHPTVYALAYGFGSGPHN